MSNKNGVQINMETLRSLTDLKRQNVRDRLEQYKYISPSQYQSLCTAKFWYAWNMYQDEFDKLIPDYKIRLLQLYPTRIMDVGTYLHKLQAKEYFSNLDVGVWMPYGSWKCSNCGAVIHNTLRPAPCKNVMKNLNTGEEFPCSELSTWVYDEYFVRNEDVGVSGMADLCLQHIDTGHRAIVDYKYVNEYNYKRFKSTTTIPKSNLTQIMIYMHATKSHYGVINYINRNDPSQSKEITIDTIPSDIVENLNSMGRFIKSIYSVQLAPELKTCESCDDKQALGCPFRDVCFNIRKDVHVGLL